jgi:FAD/FMN-containing dehydrogenase
VLWGILVFALFFLQIFTFPDILTNQEYLTISLILSFVGLIIVLLYLILIKQERKQIFASLESLRTTGMQIFTKKYELLLYSRDIGDLPKLTHFLFNFNAIAIIQPMNVVDLQSIINLCELYNIPLIPRGAGTSGYGGTLPVKNGIVVVLTNLNKIISLDEKQNIVEVECGITWEHLQKFLEEKNLTLKLYPSSAPSSTVGGWITQGGYGIGSSKFGKVENIVESVVVLGSNGKEFQLNSPMTFVGSCGTLGILWKTCLKISEKKNLIHISFSSNRQKNLLDALKAFQHQQPFFLKYDDFQNLMWKDHKFHKLHNCPGGIISMSFHEEDWNKTRIEEIKKKYELFFLSKDISEKFWNDRFYTIRMKRKGPSIIAAEVLVPTKFLVDAIEKISSRYSQKKYALELISTSDGYTLIFVWFPADIRKGSIPFFGSITYTLHWFRLFEVIQLVRRWKGIPYSSGLWLSRYSHLILEDNLQKLKLLKKEIDPKQIFNPGKVLSIRIPRFFPILSWSLAIRLYITFFGLFYKILPQKYR